MSEPIETDAEIIGPPAFEPPRQQPLFLDTTSIVAVLKDQRDAMVRQVSEIESLLGFIESADDLGVRVARLERFVGISK